MTDSTKTTAQSQQSQTSPWAPAQGLLTNLISQYGSQNPAVTGGQSDALSNLSSSVSNVPNFGNAGATAIGNLFGTDNSGQVGMLNNAYGTLKSNLSGTASGANLNPYDTPGFGDAIKTAISDATNATKSVYAGSGRDPSGAGSFSQSLGRGITQGISPTIASQYNQNYGNMLNANNSIFGAAGSTASGINNLNQQQLTNGIAGLGAASALPGLYSSPALAQLGAANAQYAQPYQNLAQLLQPSASLAGLGSQSSGSGTSTQTSQPSLLDSIKSGFGLAGTGVSTAGAAASAWPALLALSDARLKENISPVGKLNDGQNVYSFNMKGSETPQVGLLAQEVLHHEPDAVAVHPTGALMVDYHKATRKARAMHSNGVGHLRRAA
jgi:hypothetical protein